MKETFASSLRPQTLKDVIGQSHIKNFLEKLIEKKEKISLLLYGKPGIGKTSLAYALCNDLKVTYSYFNAANGNKKELEELIKINDFLIIDEIHRLNKDKQDILLPAIEFGKINIIATTSENPFFVVIPAVRSRMHILELRELNKDEILVGLEKAIKKYNLRIKISKKLLRTVVSQSNGDYRYCLNVLNILDKLYFEKPITESILKDMLPSLHFYSDKRGDGHFDLLSAFHKSLRGSDVDASLYYLARLILSGDIWGMERRMLAVAYEDVGLAAPNVALRVTNAINAAKTLGFPEGKLPLSVAVIDLAKAPKSNSAYLAINNVLDYVNNGGIHDIPLPIRDDNYASAAKLNHGVGYKYPHDYEHKINQQYLPDQIKDKKFFKTSKNDKL